MFLAAAEMRGLMNGMLCACKEMGTHARARARSHAHALTRLADWVSLVDGRV